MQCSRALTLLILAAIAGGAGIVDRIAVIVGTHVIKTSDIERELRVASFLNRQPVDESSAAMHRAADRLIDQELVREELLSGQYTAPTERDATAFLQQLKRDRFNASETQFQAELGRHHLTEDQLKRQLLWQVTVLRFIDQRFRAGVLVTDEEVTAYHQQHHAELQPTDPRSSTPEAMQGRIREILTGERINQAFEEWLAERRRATRIDYRSQAFIGSTQ